MPRRNEIEQGITYPQLDRDRLDAIIGALLFTSRNHAAGQLTRDCDAAAGYLIGFYTRRWGLPAAVRTTTGR